MATAPDITGAPTCATILDYPDTRVAQARRELNRCRNQRMFNRWIARAEKHQPLPYAERLEIGRHALDRQFVMLAEGC